MITRLAQQQQEKKEEEEREEREQKEWAERNPVRKNTRKKRKEIGLTLTLLNTRNKPSTVTRKEIDDLLVVNKNTASDELSLLTVFSQILSGNDTMVEEIREVIEKNTTIQEKKKGDYLLQQVTGIYHINIFLFTVSENGNGNTYDLVPYKNNTRNDVSYIVFKNNRYDLLVNKDIPRDMEEEFEIEKIIGHTGEKPFKNTTYTVKWRGFGSLYNEEVSFDELRTTAALSIYLTNLNTVFSKRVLNYLEKEERMEEAIHGKKNSKEDNIGEEGDRGDVLDEPDGVADISRVKANKYTRKRLTKKLTGRKYQVFRDEYQLRGLGGCYCLMPYERLDDKNKCLFKIGMTLDFTSRIEEYHTYFPEGLYSVAFLVDPIVPEWDFTKKKIWFDNNKGAKIKDLQKAMRTARYKEVESFLFEQVRLSPSAQRLFSTTRVRQRDPITKKGATEWVYTDCDTIHLMFDKAHSTFPGGDLMKFYFKGIDPVTGKLVESINSLADNKQRAFPTYSGQIIHKV